MALISQFWLAVLLGVAGVFVLRVSWARPSRSVTLNILGWGNILAAAVLAIGAYGAWGLAVSALFVMGTALLLLAPSIVRRPSWKRRPLDSGARADPRQRQNLALGRRVATFAIAGPAALLAALLLALALRSIFAGVGGVEADANVLVLACVPVFWSILATALLLMEHRRMQLATLAVAAVAAIPITILAR